jgi:[protein-PII] uridylyltransferase
MSTATTKRFHSEFLQHKEHLHALCAGLLPAASHSPGETKEKLLPVLRTWLAGQKDQIRSHYLATAKPGAMLTQHTIVMDALLAFLLESASAARPAPLALIAVGGYGRCELFPYSDIDLLFLVDATQQDAATAIAQFILYILWDLGLKVGQSLRNVEEAIALAASDFSIRTTLLDARFIEGDKALFDTMEERFKTDIMAAGTLDFVDAKLTERDARHLRFGDSRYMLEPNVKEGKGGLRDLHTLWWMARYIYPIKSIRDLVAMNLLTEEEYKRFDQSRKFLCRVRIYLHYQAGRAEERLTFDRQHALAVSMGYAHPSMNRAIERFMRRYFVAVRTVGSMTRIFCALLEEEKNRKPRKSLAWLLHMPWKLHAYILDGQRLNMRSEQAFEQTPILMIEIFKTARDYGLDIHPRAIQLMGRNLQRIDSALQHDEKANALFMDILLGDHAETTLRRMSEAGVLGKFIPDFGRIIGQTQFNMYHVYTVDEHTLVALGILGTIEKGKVNAELPLATDIVHRIKMRRVLHLALFCHDIAKGRGGDHSELGEKIALKLAARFGFSADEVETTGWLVRYHLLFSNTAFKRDIDDPKTIKDFVALVMTPERLKLLLILTAADIRAVGPAVWNAWKGALLRDLYKRTEQAMGTGHVELKQHQAGQFREDLKKRLTGWSQADIDYYLEQGTPGFIANFDLSRHAVIARMLKEAQSHSMPLLLDTHHTYEHSITEIIVCTYDHPGLFSKIAGAMALSGANIISAKIFTLKNGLVVDVFQVQDVMGQVFDRPDRLAKMSVYIDQALSDELDIAQSFRERKGGFTNPSRQAVTLPGQVFIENDASNIYSVIELTGQDRPGFLYQITRAIAELGLTITGAHISTYGTQVADVFYVKDIFGMKITHESRLRQVREKLLAHISQPEDMGA